MKAIAWTHYGAPENVLQFIEIPRPSPGDGEVLIRVMASDVTAGDVRLRAFDVPIGFWLLTRLMFGVLRPRKRVPGMDFAGVVEAVGSSVSGFQPGDRVFGTAGMHFGAHAEYLCLTENAVMIRLPDEVSFQAAVACLFGGQTAVHFLENQAGLSIGQSILINGASGGVGSAAVQIAKHLGGEVTGVCSTAHLELVRSLGADRVIDYSTQELFDEGKDYDFIMDLAGNIPLSTARAHLKAEGKFIAINTGLLTNLRALFDSHLISGVAEERTQILERLADLIREGHLKPVIDRVYSLEQIVEAHRYVDQGHKTGSVLIQIGPDSD
ncbi:MAG: NAD(P)-dependent alcohol dehydrogenase [Candidatus Thiodiazotropha sp.]